MNIASLQISNELMEALVHQLFDVQVINRSRQIMRIQAQHDPLHRYTNANIPDYSVTNNTKLPITEEMAAEFMGCINKAYDSPLEITYPYFTFTSENSIGGLQVYITQWNEDEGVTCNDLRLRTNYYTRDSNKIIFPNK